MVLIVHKNTRLIWHGEKGGRGYGGEVRLIRDGEKGGGGEGVWR